MGRDDGVEDHAAEQELRRAVLAALRDAITSGSILDGELVALDATGKPSFSLIQNSATSGATFVFFAFDLLTLAGTDLTRKPLRERRKLLNKASSGRFRSALSELRDPSTADARDGAEPWP